MRLAFVVTARASESSAIPVVECALKRGHDVGIVRMASAVLDRYGGGSNTLPEGALVVEIRSHIEGDMATTAAVTATKLQGLLDLQAPDWVYLVGDRHEVLGAAIAASYSGHRLAHQMGGERSGSIDDRVRDAVSALSDLHLAATEKAGERLRQMGHGRVVVTGCPRIDLVSQLGPGPEDHWPPFFLFCVHPDTNSQRNGLDAAIAAESTLKLAEEVKHDVHLIWPNADPGSDEVVRALRPFADRMLTHRNLSAEGFSRALRRCRLAVGNSSAFIREGSYLGTPVVLVGNRQKAREHGENVVSRGSLSQSLTAAMDPRRLPSSLYGDGQAAPRILDALESM